jgi:transcriptional regulator with XRE-family HTH domain
MKQRPTSFPIGETVRRLRTGQGKSQETLAGLAGISTRTLAGIEKGDHDDALVWLAGLANALDVDIADLLALHEGSWPAASSPIKRKSLRSERKISARVERMSTRWGTQVGAVWFPWVVAGYGPYRSANIESFYHSPEGAYPPEIDRDLAQLTADIETRAKRGEEVPYEGAGYKLARFSVSSRVGDAEEPRLVLHFEPTTYFRMLVTDQRLDVPLTAGGRTYTLRERYAANVDLRVAPVPELATHWGVGLSVVTADRQLLIAQRGNTAVDPYVYFPAMAEGASRAHDAAPNGAPDHDRIAIRGMAEELGIEIEPDELTWLSFGANSYLCEYGLIGRVDTNWTAGRIDARRSTGAAKDNWETKHLHAVPFSPVDVARFMADRSRTFSAFAIVAIMHALMHEFGIRATESAFEDITVSVSQHLPPWLDSGSQPVR